MLTLRKSFINIRTNLSLKKPNGRRFSVGYPEARHVGIIFSVEDVQKHEHIKKLVKRIQQDGKTVEVLSFLGKDKQNHEFLFDFFTEKDISFWGGFKTDRVRQFMTKEFDYLIHVDVGSNMYFERMLAKSAARCRIGNYCDRKSRFYEMMVKTKEQNNIEELVNQLYHYTRSLI